MKRIPLLLLLLAVALPLALTGCARSGETVADDDMTLADEVVIPVPVEAGTSEARELLGATTSPENTIVENAMAIPNLSQLVEALVATDLAETLNGPGEYTVFAPINQAFDRADISDADLAEIAMLSDDDKENLRELLRSHVAEGEFMYGNLTQGTEVVMLSDEMFPIARDENDQLAKRIGNADFIVYNVESSNGVIHLINLVLNPEGF